MIHRKKLLPLFLLLALLVACLAFSASAEDTDTGYIIEERYFNHNYIDVSYTPSQTNISAGQQVKVVITKKYNCVTNPIFRLVDDNNNTYSYTHESNSYIYEFEMPEANMTLTQVSVSYNHGWGSWVFCDDNPIYPYTVDGQTAIGWETQRCPYCGEEKSWSGTVTAYLIAQSATNEAVNVSFFQFADYDEAHQRPFPASQYARPGQCVYFKVNEIRCLPVRSISVKPLNEDSGESEIAISYSNGYYSFTMPEYPVKINLTVGVVEAFHNYVEVNIQNKVDATCTTSGSYDYNVWCEYCHARNDGGQILHKELPAIGHAPGEATVESFVAPTTKAEGSYDLVVKCAVCGKVVSSTHTTLERLAPSDAHVPGKPVVENYVEPTTEKEGSVDIVIYCTDCSEELSRETMTIAQLTPSDAPDTPAAPDSGKTDGSVCPWCGQTEHSIWWIGFVHSVFSFFKTIMDSLLPFLK